MRAEDLGGCGENNDGGLSLQFPHVFAGPGMVGDAADEVCQWLQCVVEDELHPGGRVLGHPLGGGGPGSGPPLGNHR